MNLVDAHGRAISYLRLSVTDRCNLRCSYCMPADGVSKATHADILRFEELEQIAEVAVSLGVEKVRITGGEPLVRKGLVPFLARLSAIPGLNFLVLTTNGILLGEMAADLRSAGVERLNVSLDSLRPETFRAITRGGDLAAVLRGIDAVVQVGLPHPKLNMVVMKGVNDEEIVDFASLARERGCTVRFIEYMPAGRAEGWQDHFLPGEEIHRRIAARYELEPMAGGQGAGPARLYRFAGGPGGIGIISAVSGHFCAGCNRIRVTARGIARSCLFADDALDLKPLLREGTRSDVASALRRFVLAKPGKHLMTPDEAHHTPFDMSGIGG
jgi:cyclic pyranopterin phosphate synthase